MKQSSWYQIVVLGLLALVSACSSYQPDGAPGRYQGRSGSPADTIGILAVSSQASSLRDFRESSYIHDLEAMLRHYHPGLTVVPYETLIADTEGSELLESLQREFDRFGYLNENARNLLVALHLPARRVLLIRIEEDVVERAPPEATDYRDQNGYVVPDRAMVSLRTYRKVVATGLLHDASSGRLIWDASYLSNPYFERAYEDYNGSSFFGSVANSVRNAFVNGYSTDKYPPAPGSLETTREVLRSIAQDLGTR